MSLQLSLRRGATAFNASKGSLGTSFLDVGRRFKSTDVGDVIGIDLGTTNSCVAVMVRRFSEVFLSLFRTNSTRKFCTGYCQPYLVQGGRGDSFFLASATPHPRMLRLYPVHIQTPRCYPRHGVHNTPYHTRNAEFLHSTCLLHKRK